MLDFDAICRGRTAFWRLLLFFDAWSWRYLSWPDILLEVIAFLRCLTLTLFVVAGRTFGGQCFSSMLDSDAICRGRRYFWKSLLAFDAWFWRWATYRISVSFLNADFQLKKCIIKTNIDVKFTSSLLFTSEVAKIQRGNGVTNVCWELRAIETTWQWIHCTSWELVHL